MNWLLLRGWAREQRHWGAFPNIFASRVGGAQPHFLDLPGAGSECGVPVPLSVRDLMASVRRRWLPLKRKHEGDWGVFAVSLGAMVAMDWMAEHPQDFRCAVLVNSSASNVGLPTERLNWRVLPDLLAVASAAGPDHFERRVLELVSNLPERRAAAQPLWEKLRREAPVGSGAALRQLLAAARFKAPKALPIPALLLASSSDRLVNVRNSERLAERFRAPIRFHPTAGHDLPLDDPEWVADQVQNFVAGLRSEFR